MTEVRRLGTADVECMRALMRVFGEAFDEIDTFAAKPPGTAYLERLLGNPAIIVLAALEEGEVIGGLVAYELMKYEQERSEFYIYDLAVREDRRRRGVATALIAKVRSIAAASNGWVVFVQADYGDEPAVALYARLGRREDVMHFDIEVP